MERKQENENHKMMKRFVVM